MRRVFAGLALLALLAQPLSAQDPYRNYEQVTVANVAIGFTTAKISSGSNSSTGHPQANWAVCRLETAQVRYTFDGTTPTTTVGTLLEVGDTLTLNGNAVLQAFRAIRTTASSGSLSCHYGS